MKWIVSLGLWTSLAHAQWAHVFMREAGTEKHVILRENGVETALTSGSEWHLYPDLSASAGLVTWVQGPSERELSVVLLDRRTGLRERWTTPTTGMALHPRFTRNGRQVFFSAPTAAGNKIARFTPSEARSADPRVEADGTRVHALTPRFVAHEGQGYFPRPSSDGSYLVFQRNFNGKKQIVEIDFLTGKTGVLADGMAPALSVDERWIAYTSKEGGSWDIWMVDRRTYQTFQVTNDPADEMAPTFTPDNRLAFASNKSGRFQLYRLQNGEWLPLGPSEADEYAPNFSGEAGLKQDVLPSFPAPLRSSLGAIGHQGKIFLCGGHAGSEHTYPPESFTDNLQMYDPATGVWKELAPRPRKAHGFQLAAKGNYLYAFGGFAYNAGTKPAWRSLDEIDRYDIAKNEWTTVGHMPRRRSSNVAVTVDDKVYLIGGWDATPKTENDAEGTFHSEVDVFDLTKETVVEAPWKIPAPLRRAFSAVERDGHILLVGGLGVGSSHFELLANVTRIDPLTGFASELSSLPFATFAPAAGLLGDDLLVFGGMFKTGQMDYEYVSHVYALDLTTLGWRHTGRSLVETKGFSQVVPYAGGLAVIGGHRYLADRDEPVSTVETFKK